MDSKQPLYLSSLESYRLEQVRECRFIGYMRFETRKDAALVNLNPGVPGQEFGVPSDIDTFVLTTRHEGVSIRQIDEFPCFVFVAIPLPHWKRSADEIKPEDLQIIGWGELYRSAADAADHKFG